MGYSSYPCSTVLVLGQSSIYSLFPSTSSTQVEYLLQSGRLADAEALLGQTENGTVHAGASSGTQDALRYLHQCLAFAFMRQTRFREATAHFVKGTIDPRIPVSYFDELRPALFSEPWTSNKDGTTSRSDEDFTKVEVWDGIREYMPDETNVDDIIATNLVRNYSPYLRPGAIPSSSIGDDPGDAGPFISDAGTQSGTRTHPATIDMREALREDANEMVKSILAAVLASAEIWSRDVIEITSTALALLYAHERDTNSLLALFTPAPATSPPSSRLSSRPSSQPPSRPGSSLHPHISSDRSIPIQSLPSHIRHASQLSQSQTTPKPVIPFRPEILEPALSRSNLWGASVEMWRVHENWAKVVEILAGLVDGAYSDISVVDPLEQIFSILAPTRPNDHSTPTAVIVPSLNERERGSLVKKWAAWLTEKDVDRGLDLLTSLQSTWHRRPTGATGRGRDKVDREKDAQKADELIILSELRNTNTHAAKRYLEWLVIGRGLGRGGKETVEEVALFEELTWNCLEDVLQYAGGDESIGRLWKAKAASYASSGTSLPYPPAPGSDAPPHPTHLSSPSPPRSAFLSYFASTTPDSPSKRARIKTFLLLQSLKEGNKHVKGMQDKIVGGGWDKSLGLEMAILYSKAPTTRITLKTLYSLGDISTAESYASSGGSTGVVSTKLGVSAAERCGLSDWSSWFAKGSGVAGTKGEDGSTRNRAMLKMLLEIYMEDGDKPQTARFLSAQAKRLDVLEMVPLVPTAWPFGTLSTYLTRSLRHAQHRRHEGQIVKAICAGQNLAVLDNTFEILREEGALVEEAVSDDGEGQDEIGGPGEEKGGGVGKSFEEKVIRSPNVLTEVVDVRVGGGES